MKRSDHLRSNEYLGFSLALASLDLLQLPEKVNEIQLTQQRAIVAKAAKALIARFADEDNPFGFDRRDIERRLA